MYSKQLKIGETKVSINSPSYFIADIGSNHDGSLSKAIDLINMAAESGANAAKFQHFKANTIVSDFGFSALGSQKSHQSKWSKSVFEVYDNASINLDWTDKLKDECDKAGITFFTSAYSKELVDMVDNFIPAFKIGSGDITWLEIIEYIASKQKPYIISSGASNLTDVTRAIDSAISINPNVSLLQCNTNYTNSLENFNYIHLNVLKTFQEIYPGMVIGLSDHTPGHATVLGAVALGARIIEKHFTDSNHNDGPDHKFAMDPSSWKDMVNRTRELELSLGGVEKKIEENELETVVLQRRAIRLSKDVVEGESISREKLDVLRPCPKDAIQPYEIDDIIGKKVNKNLLQGDYLKWVDLS